MPSSLAVDSLSDAKPGSSMGISAEPRAVVVLEGDEKSTKMVCGLVVVSSHERRHGHAVGVPGGGTVNYMLTEHYYSGPR